MSIKPMPEKRLGFEEAMEWYATDTKRRMLAEERLSLLQDWGRDSCGWVLIESPEQ